MAEKPQNPAKPAAQSFGDLAMPVRYREGKEGMDRLAKALENSGLVDDDMIQAAMGRLSEESAVSLKQTLVSMSFVTEEGIVDAVASDMGFKRARLADIKFTQELLDQIPPETAKAYQVIPVKFDDEELWLAMTDPTDVRALDDLASVLGRRITPMLASEEEISQCIRRHYESDDYASLYDEMAESDNPLDNSRRYEEMEINLDKAADGGGEEDEEAAAVKFVDLLIKQAVHERASDIHIEPTRMGLTVRARIDGVLQEFPAPPRPWQNAIVSRLKVLAGMDLAEKRLPLDGRIKLTLPGRKLDLRVATLPTIHGEAIELRILDQGSIEMELEQIGMLPATIEMFKKLIHIPNGIILVCGPTGCGKTTTLYAALRLLNTPEHKIMTLEDPVEYLVTGINQVQVNPEIGLTFPAGLRGMLRQAPDVMLVGEIRDSETAENAIRAALTGHLVFSSLHTNDAPSAMMRLMDMGVKPYLVAGSLQAVLAQRLIRMICPSCKEAYKPRPEEFHMLKIDPELYPDVDFFRGRGCERCGHTGYRGRTAVMEVLVMDHETRRRVIRGETSQHIKRYAVSQGMRTLANDGWEKILLGRTTVQEIYATVGVDD